MVGKMLILQIHSTAIPDEFFLSSFALNSPRHENRTHNVGLHWLKAFSANDPYNLCRHLDESDFCGQGPSDIDTRDHRDLV